MSAILPSWLFQALIWGALVWAGMGTVGLIALFVADLRRKSTW